MQFHCEHLQCRRNCTGECSLAIFSSDTIANCKVRYSSLVQEVLSNLKRSCNSHIHIISFTVYDPQGFHEFSHFSIIKQYAMNHCNVIFPLSRPGAFCTFSSPAKNQVVSQSKTAKITTFWLMFFSVFKYITTYFFSHWFIFRNCNFE